MLELGQKRHTRFWFTKYPILHVRHLKIIFKWAGDLSYAKHIFVVLVLGGFFPSAAVLYVLCPNQTGPNKAWFPPVLTNSPERQEYKAHDVHSYDVPTALKSRSRRHTPKIIAESTSLPLSLAATLLISRTPPIEQTGPGELEDLRIN